MARATFSAPLSSNLALVYLLLQRASRSFWQLRGLVIPAVWNAILLERLPLLVRTELLGRGDNGGIDNLPAHVEIAWGPQRKIEAVEQGSNIGGHRQPSAGACGRKRAGLASSSPFVVGQEGRRAFQRSRPSLYMLVTRPSRNKKSEYRDVCNSVAIQIASGLWKRHPYEKAMAGERGADRRAGNSGATGRAPAPVKFPDPAPKIGAILGLSPIVVWRDGRSAKIQRIIHRRNAA